MWTQSPISNIESMSTETDLAVGSYLLLEPDGGERLKFLGQSTMRLKVDGADTDEALTFYEYVSEPGVTGPPQHIHHGHDETFYVVEGTYEFTFGTERVIAEPGAFLYIPRGRPHTFRNSGHGLGRIVGTFAPARFAEYFRELADIIERTGGPPDRAQWAELYGRYDTTFLDDPHQTSS
jgi:mannose-6-phosphate isomerase-like protein (cupin superfamily)